MTFAPENEIAIVNSLSRIALMLQLKLMNEEAVGISADSGLWDFIQDFRWFTENHIDGSKLKDMIEFTNVKPKTDVVK